MDLLLDDPLPARRRFLRHAGGGALGLVAALSLGGCEIIAEAIRNRPTRPRLRVGSATLAPQLATYKAGVAAMKALPASDPRSWAAQAAIHGTAAGFNLCQHGTPHFLSWHRAYVLYFEQIIRRLTGEPRFALPYWNWNRDNDLHPDFLDTTGPLFHPRNRTSLAGFSEVMDSTLDPVMADSNFLTFSSTLEGPHGNVHIHIGRDMGGGGSANDPVFWMHHCMVDYAWAKWNLELGFDNPNDPGWTDTTWTHFVQGDGSPATMSAGITTLMPLISYQYETSAIGTPPMGLAARVAEDYAQLRKRVEAGASVQLDVRQRFVLAERALTPLARPWASPPLARAAQITGLLTERDPASNAFLRITYASFPAANDFFVRVFVNLPSADARTPVSDPHYAGSLSFFGTPGGHHEQMHPSEHLVNVTPVLRRLMERGELREGGDIAVQLVAVPAGDAFQKPDLVLELQRIELLVTPVIVKQR